MSQNNSAIPKNALCFFKDGHQWVAVFGDFINLQESPAGYGDTRESALDELIVACQNLIQKLEGK